MRYTCKSNKQTCNESRSKVGGGNALPRPPGMLKHAPGRYSAREYTALPVCFSTNSSRAPAYITFRLFKLIPEPLQCGTASVGARSIVEPSRFRGTDIRSMKTDSNVKRREADCGSARCDRQTVLGFRKIFTCQTYNDEVNEPSPTSHGAIRPIKNAVQNVIFPLDEESKKQRWQLRNEKVA